MGGLPAALLLLADSRLPGHWDLADKELAALFADIAGRGAQVVSVLDCCHSGSGTRAVEVEERARLAPADHRDRPWATFLPGVAGIGEKTAASLLNSYRDLSGILAAASEPEPKISGSVRSKLAAAGVPMPSWEEALQEFLSADNP